MSARRNAQVGAVHWAVPAGAEFDPVVVDDRVEYGQPHPHDVVWGSEEWNTSLADVGIDPDLVGIDWAVVEYDDVAPIRPALRTAYGEHEDYTTLVGVDYVWEAAS